MAVLRAAFAVMLFCAVVPASAQTASDHSDSLETITVVGTSPLPGTGIDRDLLPTNVQTLNDTDLSRDGTPSIMTAVQEQLGSVSINDDLADQFQPDILYRGFEASPALGTPEGLAVYQNGVRINEAFGDVVNWDLFPSIAIQRVDVLGSDPVYGLNALGGAVVVNMKNGFTFQGGEADIEGGSFGLRSGEFQFGVNSGIFGAYIAGNYLDEDGWRQFSPDNLRQLYAVLSAHTDTYTLDLSFTGGNNRLFGESPAPIQTIEVNRALIFTSPQYEFNQLEFVTLDGTYKLSDAVSLQANGYYREYRQTVVNGNTSDYTSCGGQYTGYICQGDGVTPAFNQQGHLLPDITSGGAYVLGENDFESIRSVSTGGSIQANDTADLLGHPNNFTIGASIDHEGTDFQTSAELGIVYPDLSIGYGGEFPYESENDPNCCSNVGLNAIDRYYAVYATDTFNVTPELAVTASGRYNVAQIDIADREGTNLTGQNRYSRFNPAGGATYKITPAVTAYFGYSETNRTPTASEIECSDPNRPCLLPTDLAGDPPTLKQVVAHTYEGGLRGTLPVSFTENDRLSWDFDLYRTDLDNDIYGIATTVSTGFFQNIGGTRRQGADLDLHYRAPGFSAYLSYSYVQATFQSALTLNSPSSPFQDAFGNIEVRPGDELPGIPEHRVKVGADWQPIANWTVGGGLTFYSEQYYRGDESNQLPELPAYVVMELHSSYDINDNFEVFVDLKNAFNADYATFGVLSDPTGIGAPGVPANGVTNGPGVDNRFESPGAPISAVGGIKFRFGAPSAPAEAAVTPVPPPAPAPVPQAPTAPEKLREFQVFFDFDKSTITDTAARVIQAAADVVKAGGIAHITVTGHTDTVGTARYNQGLSERRAASVKTQLVKDGIPGSEVATVGAGKNGLLVPTADGVREPQNRRAVIELR